jgi:hypothetical protein
MLSAGVLAGLCAGAASAQTWNLAAMAEATPTANPNGPWSYRWGDPTGGQLLNGPFPAFYGVAGEYLWYNQQSFPNSAQCDLNATGGVINAQTFSFGPDALRLDPQNTAGVYVRFTAPAGGAYHVAGAFNTCDISPHTKHIQMWSDNGQFHMPMINRDLPSGGQTFDFDPVNLAAGQTVWWLVTSVNGDASNLSTCVSVTVTLDGDCYANCDASTAPPVLNVNDFVCFQSRFASGDSYANCDGSTAPPVLNVNDFVCFQQRFAAGCP